MTLVTERVLVTVGHALQCPACRDLLREDLNAVLMRQGLTRAQRELIQGFAAEDWSTVGTLAKALGVSRCELEEATRHPRCRLRHL
jgi:hypothetical protein